MNEIVLNSCPLCNGKRLERFMVCKDYYASGREFDLIICTSCEFVFTQGTPPDSEMDSYYQSPQYISHSDTQKGIINIFYHLVRNFTLTRKARLVIAESHRTTGQLLDIGAGTGYFADTMAGRKWKVNAIEKNEGARAFAKEHLELDIDNELALNTFAPGTFDVITLWHVMEHWEQPDQLWKRLHELLTEKGILIIAVPNHLSYDAQKYRQHWAAYDVPRHRWHFASVTLQQWGLKHGFIMSARYPMPFDAFYISMLSEKNKGRRFPFIRGMVTGLKAWYYAQSKKEKSSSITYVFRKKPE